MKDFMIIQHYDKNVFVDDVKAHLKLGWKLEGGVSVAVDNDGRLSFTQSLTKEFTLPPL